MAKNIQTMSSLYDQYFQRACAELEEALRSSAQEFDRRVKQVVADLAELDAKAIQLIQRSGAPSATKTRRRRLTPNARTTRPNGAKVR
jgi:hypothetical protein